jgi:hypothetical protein
LNGPFIFAQSQNYSSVGSSAGAPFRMGFGARGIALGNALSAVRQGDLLGYYNPAVIPFQFEPTLVASYSILSLDRHLNFLSYTRSLKPNAGLSLSLINAGVGNIDGRNRDGLKTETLNTSENVFSLSFGLHPSANFSMGVSAKILYYLLYEDMKSTSVAIDFGMLYLLTQEVTLAAVVQDINAKYNWNSTNLYGLQGNDFSDKFPLRYRIGITYTPIWFRGLISGEYEYVGTDKILRFGSEIEVINSFFIRFGIDQIAFNSDLSPIPSFGFEFDVPISTWNTSFHYTYVIEPFSPSGFHIISFSLRFK